MRLFKAISDLTKYPNMGSKSIVFSDKRLKGEKVTTLPLSTLNNMLDNKTLESYIVSNGYDNVTFDNVNVKGLFDLVTKLINKNIDVYVYGELS